MRIETVRNYLDVTWDDPGTNTKLAGILARAENKLSSYAGVVLDFTDEETPEAQLLLDLCRYIWEKRSEEFEPNYSSEIIMLRANAAAAEAGDDAESEAETNEVGEAGDEDGQP